MEINKKGVELSLNMMVLLIILLIALILIIFFFSQNYFEGVNQVGNTSSSIINELK